MFHNTAIRIWILDERVEGINFWKHRESNSRSEKQRTSFSSAKMADRGCMQARNLRSSLDAKILLSLFITFPFFRNG